ncbi:MAG: FAD-dependent oxidoreductase [Candidatus Bathyarchaeota archaeon]|jgi:NAD(P)H-nitrite reductase large subunit|nr:FAD-dependent oxidoreductase [Candidatus Bathyarchaeota archaeon]
MAKYVIVGASAAGIGAVEAIRDIDPVGSITVISDEICPQYSRPMISDFVSGKADFCKMKCRTDEFWKENSAEALTGKKAIALNLTEKTVQLESGEKIAYEKLLLATGGKPFVPKIEGSEKDGVFTFTTIKDAELLAAKIDSLNAKSAVVVGAGLIGISVTEALVKRGLKVTLVELQEKILSLLLDTKASDLVEGVIRNAGVNIVTGQSVQKIVGKPNNENAVGGVILTKGEHVPCDLVIVAIGVIPRTELVAGTAVKINRGIIVDNTMQTNVPDVYASGDVAEAYDFILNQNRPLPLWPLAVLEGQVAGYNMAGKKTTYTGGTNMSSLKYFGIPIISVGLANPKEDPALEVLVKHDSERNIYKKLVLRNNVVVGMTLVNNIERAGVLFYLMKNCANVKKFKEKLLSDDFSLATLPVGLQRKMCVVQ